MFKKGDFHIHSSFSDGALSPTEIVKLAKFREIDILALTDHNNMDGIDEGIKAGEEYGIKVIPGVEVSTRFRNTKVHILGYFKREDYKDELLEEVLIKIKLHKAQWIQEVFKDKFDFHGYKDRLYVETGIELLKFFGATVILAHPILLPKEDFHIIKHMDFHGIEAKYFSNTEEDTSSFISFAKANSLLYTAGSDFHAPIERCRAHGLLGDVYLDEDEIKDFLVRSRLFH